MAKKTDAAPGKTEHHKQRMKPATWAAIIVAALGSLGTAAGLVVNNRESLAVHVAQPFHSSSKKAHLGYNQRLHAVETTSAVLEAGQQRIHEDMREMKTNQRDGFNRIESAIKQIGK